VQSREQLPLPTSDKPRAILAICAGLVAMIWAVYGQTLRADFVNYDDNTYIYENPGIVGGLSWRGIAWAFTHTYSSNWHPLTWISHMLDCQLYGLKASGHHFTNVLLHSATTVMLFIVLRGVTGARWRSAFATVLFAVHPLHVESVAWISERKDVLSGLFFVLTLGAYVRYARRPSIKAYLLVAFLFGLGLMSKSMLVTMPFVLLLVDFWPLRRFTASSSTRRLLAEKIPLGILATASCVATLIAQNGVISRIEQLPVSWRVTNAFVSYVLYIGQMIWPTRLAPFYPHLQSEIQTWQVALSILLVCSITLAALILCETRPYVLTGWLWYAGMLVPVIGIIQVGLQAHADRYTYLPQIGLYLVVVWGVADIASQSRLGRQISTISAVVAVVIFTWLAWLQTTYWHDSERLWKRALAVTEHNDVAHILLGDIFMRRGQVTKAVSEFRAALQVRPDSSYAEDYLGMALFRGGQIDEAIDHLKAALRLMPDHPTAHFDLANAFFQKGDLDAAITQYQQELLLKPPDIRGGFTQPDYAATHYNLANCYVRNGDFQLAIKEYKEALELSPRNPGVHNNLAVALLQIGKTQEAVAQWEEVLRIQSDNTDAQGNLAWVLATSSDRSIRNGRQALDLAQRAQQRLGRNSPQLFRVLAAAYAEDGNFPEAITAAQKGLDLATAQGDIGLAGIFQSDLALYRSDTPLRERSDPTDR
jgi:tetratricopeptide (TPR) repeat protein